VVGKTAVVVFVFRDSCASGGDCRDRVRTKAVIVVVIVHQIGVRCEATGNSKIRTLP